MWNKVSIALIAILLIVSIPAIAQHTSIPKPKLKFIGALGTGYAINEKDPMDFYILKVAIAKVAITLAGEHGDVNTGILFLDNIKYRLRNIIIQNGSIEADIYQGGYKVGSVKADLFVKGRYNVWAGSMNLNESSYYIYVTELRRRFKPVEAIDVAVDKCKERPELCKGIVKKIGNLPCDNFEDRNCRYKIIDFCKKNPLDKRCLAVRKVYCKLNPEDVRCRNELLEKCEKYPESDECVNLARIVKVKKYRLETRSIPRWIKRVKKIDIKPIKVLKEERATGDFR